MRYKLLFVLLLLPLFVSCQSSEEVTVSLVQEEKEDVLIEANTNEYISLPMAEKEGHFFIGWSDGETYYYNEYLVEGEIQLSAEFEAIEDAFESIEYVDDEVIFNNYIGQSKHVVIPHMYNDTIVKTITGRTFEDSLIESIKIPNSVLDVNYNAFKNAERLKSIEFYGDIIGYQTFIMPSIEVESLMQEYGCQLDTSQDPTEENPWVFPEGCPITKITEKTPTVITPDGEYFSYKSVRDLSVDDTDVIQMINETAFDGATALETIVLPKNLIFFNPLMFEDNINLKEILIDENNKHYAVKDNIIYSKDLTELYLYPHGLEADSFVIPSQVEMISDFAFFNRHMETISLPRSVGGFRGMSFFGLTNLKEVLVSSENIRFSSEDGILYDYQGVTLLYYPAGREALDYTISDNVTAIGDGAFANQQHLENIELIEGLMTIGNRAFFQTQKIRTYNLPSTLASIGYGAFYHEDDIVQELIINNTNDVLLSGGNPLNMHEDLKIYIPNELMLEYTNDPRWGSYLNFFFPLSEREE